MIGEKSRVKPGIVPQITSAAHSRDVILQAAINILDQHGAGALTVRSVAAAAGCSTTGVYTWFGGKSGLVEAIYVDGFQRFGAALEQTVGAGGGLHLAQQSAAYRVWALENPTHYMVMFGRAVPDFEPSDAAKMVALGTFQLLINAAALAIDEGLLIGDPAELAFHLWAGIHGYVSLELADMSMTASRSERDRLYALGCLRLMRGCREG